MAGFSFYVVVSDIWNKKKNIKAIDDGKRALKEAQEEIDKRLELEQTLADILDEDGNIRGKLRLPGSLPKKPNKTPCGRLCKHAFFDTREIVGDLHHGDWRCLAGSGDIAKKARRMFLNDENQCVMFDRVKE